MSNHWMVALRAWAKRNRTISSLACALAIGSTAQAQQYPDTSATQQVAYNPNASVEERLQWLESQYSQQQTINVSLSRELADAKAAAAPAPYVLGSDPKMAANWKNGVEMESANKDFRGKFRGRTQLDWIGYTAGSQPYYNNTSGNQGSNAVDFRRLRLGAEGTFYEQFDWALEFDIVNSVRVDPSGNPSTTTFLKNQSSNQVTIIPAPTDVWINMKDVPIVGNVRAGNIKYPVGLEHSNSSRFLDFMERSLNQDAFTGVFNNGFAPGVMIYDWNEDQTATYALALYKNTQNVYAYDAGSQNNAVASRVTWTPFYDEEAHGRYMMHVGLSTQYSGTTQDQLRIRARPSLRNGISQYWPTVIDTGTFFCDDQILLNPEWALVWGRWHFQAEYMGSFLQGVRTTAAGAGTSQYVDGYYVQAMYFLTGEHREYERKAGAFGRVVPHENFHALRRNGRRSGSILTSGAWQVGYRFNQLDLRSGLNGNGTYLINGGIMDDHTFGINHFINPNLKVQYNFVVSNRNIPGNQIGQVAGTTTSGTAPFNTPSSNAPSASYGFGIRLAHDF